MFKPLHILTFLIIGLMLPISYAAKINVARAADANNLISDADFVNWQTLDGTGVQQFLNSKGGTRLRGFSEGGRSAAQIIADAARSNGINPLVILSTIQKEESLVESNTNFDFRVNWAMGYAICDSCALDDANVVKYKGFTKQVDNAAWQLKYNYNIAASDSNWGVGKTMIIDGTAVVFRTRATSALYRYTPHLPGNQNFATIYARYRTFSYASKYAKTKIAVDKSALVAQKLAVANSKNGSNQSGQGGISYNTQYVNQVGGGAIAPGAKKTVYVYLKNTGTSTWTNTGSNPVYLGNSSSQDRGSVFTGGRNVRWNLLSRSVAPGQVGVFSITLTAPSGTGVYVEKYRPVMEGITWFGNEISFTFNVQGSPTGAKK